MEKIQAILNSNDKAQIKALFNFNLEDNSNDEIIVKFNLWVRHLFPLQFKEKDAPFHKEIDLYNLEVYRGTAKAFIDVVFRGGAKTTRTKMFFAFCITSDTKHFRKFWKILTKDITNAKQLVTDIYNIIINSRVKELYPIIFIKSDLKREETMGSFTTSFGVKVRSGTVGVEHRGQQQGDEETARPDFIFLDDFETRATLRSAVVTKALWDNMEEARLGLSKNGGCVYTCNYLSERGNVHKLVEKSKKTKNWKLLIVPIMFKNKPMWDLYTMEEIQEMKDTDDDFAGERMCEPSAGHDIFFDRSSLERMISKEPFKVVADFKMFYPYNPSHRYGSGHDVGGGVGLDHSTSVFWDFSTIPARVVATYKCNTIQPDIFGDEIKNEAERYGEPIVAPENNKFDTTIGRLKQIYDNLYFTEDKKIRAGLTSKVKTYGWNTNRMTKSTMLFDLKKAVEDGQAELTDEDLISELKSYTRDDLMDNDDDVRLTTRHFDLLMAAGIGFAMRNFAEATKSNEPVYKQAEYESPMLDN